MRKYSRKAALKYHQVTNRRPYLPAVSLLVLGFLIFGSVAVYDIAPNRTVNFNGNTTTDKVTSEQQSDTEILGTDAQNLATTPSAVPTKIKSTPTSTTNPTATPTQIKEIHTKETIEVKSVVEVTPTPVPTAVPTHTPSPTPTALPTPTPTLDTSPFEITFVETTTSLTITANKDLKSCNYSVCQCGQSGCNLTICSNGSGQISANNCTINYSDIQWIEHGSVESIYGETKNF